MAEDWATDVYKYVPDADSGVIAGIVRYCGIALRNRDSSLVSFTDSTETDRVRENFLKKKLALTDPDSDLDAAIAAVGVRMKGDPTRNRVTVYYLLAEAYGKLGLFGGGKADDDTAVAPLPLMAAAAVRKEPQRRPGAAIGLMQWLPMGVLVLGGVGFLWLLSTPKAPQVVAAPEVAAAPVAAPAPAIPDGAGITNTEVDGKPVVSIYFDTAKSDIYPNFEARTEALRTWLAEHPDTHLQISGFNDPRGDAAFNAELSKNRAFAVRDSLAKLGVPLTAMDLVKPADTTDTVDSLAGARRVDVTVEDGPVPVAEVAAEAPAAAAAAAAPAAPTP
ncbi:MAG: DUF2853 family protein [Polymorphobacter sp.]